MKYIPFTHISSTRRQISLVIVTAIVAISMISLGRGSAASSQSFQLLSGQAQLGMLMSLTRNPGVIEPTTNTNAASLVGVVAPNDNNLNQLPGEINVQTDGEAKALVSTLGGNVLVGDKVTSSALQGIGAKLNGSGWIVGTAQSSLDAKTHGAVSSLVTDSQGGKHTVYVALIPLAVHVTYYNASAASNNWTPKILQQIANNVAGKNVSTQALVLGFLLFVIGLAIATVIIVSSIRSGFLAISRQPLSKFVILREEWRSFGAAIVILVFAALGGILLLKYL